MSSTETDPTGAPLAFDPNDYKSDLEMVADDITSIAAPLTRLVHPVKESYVLVFESEIPYEVIDGYQKKATRKGRRDARLMNGLVVSNHCVHIERNGEPLRGSNDKPVTFRSPEFQQVLGVTTAVAAAAKFLGGDGYLGSMAGQVMLHAGYGAEIEEAGDRPDPTERG